MVNIINDSSFAQEISKDGAPVIVDFLGSMVWTL